MPLPSRFFALLAQYSKRSVFLFSDKSRFRKAVVWIAESPWFDMFILMVIFANSVVLGLSDYSHADAENVLLDTSWRNRVVSQSEPFFTAVFTFEAALKIIGMGFVMSRGSYLRDAWNILDFVVVLAA